MDFQMMMMKKTQSFPLSWILILILASRSGKKIYCISQGLSKAPRSASWRQAQDLLRGLFQDSQAPSATPREVPAVGSHHGFSEDVQGYSNPLHVQITAITTIVYLVYIYIVITVIIFFYPFPPCKRIWSVGRNCDVGAVCLGLEPGGGRIFDWKGWTVILAEWAGELSFCVSTVYVWTPPIFSWLLAFFF